ncbi:MAG: 30S ribosomal protein S20 [Anaerolineales bacterium]|nr:30S ribosomal protein S20 [Anaerolineales bacterium]
MANTASAKKRVRQNEKRRMRNRVWLTRARSTVKQARITIDSEDSAASVAAVNKAISELDRAASKGVIHKRNAARRKSRLLKKLSTLEKGK